MAIAGTKQQFEATWVGLAPSFSGVYALWNGDELIYIGGTNQIRGLRARLTDHLYDDDPCIKQATHFQYEVTATPWLRERQLVLEFSGVHGALPRCNDVIPSGIPYV